MPTTAVLATAARTVSVWCITTRQEAIHRVEILLSTSRSGRTRDTDREVCTILVELCVGRRQ